MIIDLILDRKYDIEHHHENYSPKNFYNDVEEYNEIFDGIGKNILKAMDNENETEVKKALCEYIYLNSYNPDICHFINRHKWLK